MTDKLTLWLPTWMLQTLAPERVEKKTVRLNGLVSEANLLLAHAATEERLADAARERKFAGDSPNLGEIAVWHYGRAIEKYRTAAGNFFAAAKLAAHSKRGFYRDRASNALNRAAFLARIREAVQAFENRSFLI